MCFGGILRKIKFRSIEQIHVDRYQVYAMFELCHKLDLQLQKYYKFEFSKYTPQISFHTNPDDTTLRVCTCNTVRAMLLRDACTYNSYVTLYA